jgi:riboflavin-specific deaminase-like protein
MPNRPTRNTLPGYLDLDFPAPPATRPYVIVNMVMSADGKIVIEGTEEGLGSSDDQRLMAALRTHADAVLNGAETLRKSGSTPDPGTRELRGFRKARGLPPSPLGVILSRSGKLPLDSQFFTAPDFPGLAVLADTVSDELRAEVEAAGRPVLTVPAEDAVPSMLRVLRRDYGVRLLLCEGGAMLNGALFDAGVVDEYFVTVAPRAVGGNGALTPIRGERDASVADTRNLRLRSAVPNSQTGEVYLRYDVGTRKA